MCELKLDILTLTLTLILTSGLSFLASARSQPVAHNAYAIVQSPEVVLKSLEEELYASLMLGLLELSSFGLRLVPCRLLTRTEGRTSRASSFPWKRRVVRLARRLMMPNS